MGALCHIAVKEGQLHDYESRIGRPIEHAEYMSKLTDLRDELKLGLPENAPERGKSTRELSEHIHALRASVTVEAAPERVTRKAARAEVPVTARIRARRADAEPVSAGQLDTGSSDATEQELQVIEESAGQPAAEIIPLPVHVQAEEKPEAPPAPQPVLPAMYQERMPEHARQVTKRRLADGAQLRLF